MKQYLRIYCHDRQKRWAAWLALAEFAYNSSTASSHGYSPFRALYGFEPKTIHLSSSDDDSEFKSPAAEEWLDRMTTIHSQIQNTLKRINNRRSELSLEKSHQFHVGDQVLIDRRNLTVKAGNNRSLTQKWIGPYKVIKVVGHYAYKLELPIGIRLHYVIHTTMPKPFKTREGDDHMELDNEEDQLFYEVEGILDSRHFGRTVKYRVRWKGYGENDDTWKSIDTLQGQMGMIREFHQRKPRAP